MDQHMRKYIYAVLLSMSLIFSGAAFSQTTEKAIKYRQGAFSIMGWNFGAMADMIKGKRPYDQADFARRADIIAYMSHIPLEGFIDGSNVGKTKAKPEVWENMDDFKSKMDAFQIEAVVLESVSKEGGFDKVKKQFIRVGKTCKSCHDKYRNK